MNSIKDSTREKRGKGQRRNATGDTKIPPNWKAFLQDNTNKKELCPPDKQSFKLPVSRQSFTDIQRCDHEDADITITVHVQHALNKGCRQVFVCTVHG